TERLPLGLHDPLVLQTEALHRFRVSHQYGRDYLTEGTFAVESRVRGDTGHRYRHSGDGRQVQPDRMLQGPSQRNVDTTGVAIASFLAVYFPCPDNLLLFACLQHAQEAAGEEQTDLGSDVCHKFLSSPLSFF